MSVQWQEVEFDEIPDPEGLDMEILRIEIDRVSEALAVALEENARLRAELIWVRSQASSGYARGRIKTAPRPEWPPKTEAEDLLQ